MLRTASEKFVSIINSNVFFKEFTFTKNDFKNSNGNLELQFADSVVWIDNLFFIYQIKEQNELSLDSVKWFKNKILNKAVNQIKSTLKYISDFQEINIENEKGHKINIGSSIKPENIRKIIIYFPNEPFPNEMRNLKFRKSSKINLIHLFHSEDYTWICKYLITPTEIDEYLHFRERLYNFNSELSNALPEQYFLAHFLETIKADHFNFEYLENLVKHTPSSINKCNLKI